MKFITEVYNNKGYSELKPNCTIIFFLVKIVFIREQMQQVSMLLRLDINQASLYFLFDPRPTF